VNVESKVGEPNILAMLELLTRLWTPFTIHEPIECLSKVLDGTPVACDSRIGRGLDVMFRVSFSITIMSLVLSFKSWKLNNGVFISFCATSFIWSWHSISWLVENCVFSWCTCIPRTWKFDALATYGVVVSSPFANKVRFSFVLKGQKNYDMIARAPLALVIIGLELDVNPLVWITYLVVETLVHVNLLCRKIGREKKSGKFLCESRIVCTGKNILPNHGTVWEAIEWPRRSLSWSWTLYKLGMTSWLGRLAFHISKLGPRSFCKVWTWIMWAWSTSLLSTLCSFFLAFLLELPLVGKTWMEGWGALSFGWRAMDDASRFCCGNQSYFRFGNLTK